MARAIEKGLSKGNLKALVVRVDSPGGSVLASERIRQVLLAAKQQHKLPVVVSMGSVAASGGYWVATPGDFIFAEPSTITGSIGVFALLHGHAHGTEMPASASSLTYGAGFMLATISLHAAGIGAALSAQKLLTSPNTMPLRYAGAAIALCGLVLMTS